MTETLTSPRINQTEQQQSTNEQLIEALAVGDLYYVQRSDGSTDLLKLGEVKSPEPTFDEHNLPVMRQFATMLLEPVQVEALVDVDGTEANSDEIVEVEIERDGVSMLVRQKKVLQQIVRTKDVLVEDLFPERQRSLRAAFEIKHNRTYGNKSLRTLGGVSLQTDQLPVVNQKLVG